MHAAERRCSECIHYKLRDEKLNYEQNGCGNYVQKIYGCELWRCHFEPANPETKIYDVSITFSHRVEASSLEEAKKKYAEMISDWFFTVANPEEVDAAISDDQTSIALVSAPDKTSAPDEEWEKLRKELANWDIDTLKREYGNVANMFKYIKGKESKDA